LGAEEATQIAHRIDQRDGNQKGARRELPVDHNLTGRKIALAWPLFVRGISHYPSDRRRLLKL